MRMHMTVAAAAALIGISGATTAQTAASGASAAASDSRANVGAVHGVAPTPATGSAPATPKLIRHTPGKGEVTQPAPGASSGARASAPDGGK